MDYYVYHHIRLDTNEPFYVGKGKNIRDGATHQGLRNRYWRNVYLKCNKKIKVERIHTNLNENKALELENKLYNEYISKGYKLTNIITPGKLGSTGHKKSKKWRSTYGEMMSKINKGKKLTTQHKENLSKSLKGRDCSYLNTPVEQYTKEGEFLREFGSVKEAAYFMGYTNGKGVGISGCLRGIQPTAYGYKWKYKL